MGARSETVGTGWTQGPDCAAGTRTVFADGRSADTARRWFEVERYHVQLRPDLSTTALSGAQRIRLRSTSDHLTQLTFSPNALQILDAGEAAPLVSAS